MELAERLAGGVWGHLVGDAVGVPYEFRAASAIRGVRWGGRGTHNQPPGTWSDDGALMLALLDSLLEKGFDTRRTRAVGRWPGIARADMQPAERSSTSGTPRGRPCTTSRVARPPSTPGRPMRWPAETAR